MKKSKLRKIIKEEIHNIFNEAKPLQPNLVGGNTGVNLSMRKIINLLKAGGYPYSISDGNKLFPKSIRAGSKHPDVGTVLITKNGQLFGDDLWGMDISSEEEVIPAIDEFEKNQIEYLSQRHNDKDYIAYQSNKWANPNK